MKTAEERAEQILLSLGESNRVPELRRIVAVALRAYAAECVREDREKVKAEADKPFIAGTRVTNCVIHMPLDITARPEDCRLCLTDMKGFISYVLRVNEFVNERLDAIRALPVETP